MKYRVTIDIEADVETESGKTVNWVNVLYDPYVKFPTHIALDACAFLMCGIARECRDGFEVGLDDIYKRAVEVRFNEIKKED